MKVKLFLVVLLLLSMFLVIHGNADTYSPSEEFNTAKKIAMSTSPDEDGDYVFGVMRSGKDGVSVGYFVYYGSENKQNKDKFIVGGYVVGDTIYAVTYNESDGFYRADIGSSVTGRRYMSQKITEEDAAKAMRNILKHISYNGISF